MQLTRLSEATPYTAPKHTGVYSMHLQHQRLGSDAPYWVGCSYYLPGAAADWDASPVHKIYIVLEGELTIAFDEKEIKLGPMDSVTIGPSENRQVRNDTNQVVTILVVMPYPPR